MDRLTFSVIWDMTEDGKVLSQWAGRTVIRSCTKLAYEHAQDMIEGTFDAANHPLALSSPHTWPQVLLPQFGRLSSLSSSVCSRQSTVQMSFCSPLSIVSSWT